MTNKIYLIRGQKVMLDRDLAEPYGVETKYLKRQVNRNIERFPNDFMFQLSSQELDNWRRQFVTSIQVKKSSNEVRLDMKSEPPLFKQIKIVLNFKISDICF